MRTRRRSKRIFFNTRCNNEKHHAAILLCRSGRNTNPARLRRLMTRDAPSVLQPPGGVRVKKERTLVAFRARRAIILVWQLQQCVQSASIENRPVLVMPRLLFPRLRSRLRGLLPQSNVRYPLAYLLGRLGLLFELFEHFRAAS